MSDKPLLTVGEAARELAVPEWQVRAVFSEGLLPEAPRVGRSRALRREDLPAIAEKVRERFTPATPAAVPA
jgi:hypothetical protein